MLPNGLVIHMGQACKREQKNKQMSRMAEKCNKENAKQKKEKTIRDKKQWGFCI